MFKGIIFDLDGVIVHTDKLHYQAWKKVADRIGIDFNKEINNRLRGVSRMESLNIILGNDISISDTEKQVLADEKNTIYRQLLSSLSEQDVSNEVIYTLDELSKQDVKLAIGSSSKNARFILNQVKLTQYFDAISDGNNIIHSKPNPEVFLKAAEYLMLSPTECAVVEDAWSGIDAAVDGGFYSVGLGDAYRYDKTEMKIVRFSEILSLI